MLKNVKPGGKALIILLIVGAGIGGFKWWQGRPKTVAAAAEVGTVSLPDAPEASLTGSAAVKLPLPSTKDALNGGVKIDMYEMQWAAQTSLNYANGGVRTTKGSLLDKAGIDMNIITQGDDFKSRDMMVSWVQKYQKGETKDGFFIADMGSQMDSYVGAMDSILKPLGKEFQIVIFGAIGRSLGEDQYIGQAEWKTNPQAARGSVCRGVRQGGDLDIVIKWGGDNKIPINQNEKLYYPDAINLSYSADFISAAKEYNAMQKETRKLVRNGKTGKDTTVEINSCATWTPGDVIASEGRGGATIISTKQYASIMPCLLITCRKFLSDNNSKIQDFLASVYTAADQVKTFTDVKEYALGLDAQIWNEKDKPFWVKYYNGIQKGDMHLGGSMVYNLKDAQNEFGLHGGTDIYKEVYNTFLEKHKGLYGKELQNAPLYQDVVDKSYMGAVMDNHPELLEGKAFTVQYADKITEKMASRNEQINFATGSAVINVSSHSLLDEVYSDLVASDGLKVGVYGHTDNTGNSDKNQQLSEARAESVKQYFLHKGLPTERIESKGYGDQQPVADNNTSTGRAQNRRVEIALGQ